METTFIDYQYPELSNIRMTNSGKFIVRSFDSAIGVIKTLDNLFKQK